MDRVAFLIESTGERLDCLLNPESFEITRVSGVRPKRALGGAVNGRSLPDAPLFATGGGTTEVKLDLLFDVTLDAAGPNTGSALLEDVRDLTKRIWDLAENETSDGSRGELRIARLVWGKAWNIPGVVLSVAERFECFTASGVPQRSWLRLRFRRVPEPEPRAALPESAAPNLSELLPETPGPSDALGDFPTVETTGGNGPEDEDRPMSEPLYLVAHRQGLPPSAWRTLAYLGDVDDPFHLPPGTSLRIPPA